MPHRRSLIQPVLDDPAYRALLAAFSRTDAARGLRPAAVLAGLTPTAKSLVAAGLAHDLARPIIVLTNDNDAADGLRATAATFLSWLEGDDAALAVSSLPAFDCSPYENRSPHAEISEQRAVALWNVACSRTRILFVPLVAALWRFRDAAYYRSLSLEFKPGGEVSLDDLVEHLNGVGYEAGEPVEDVGQYSQRGGIIDVFSPESEWPVRIEFFGDRIESMRQFDPTNQRSRKTVPVVRMLPLIETKRSPQFFQQLVRKMMERSNVNGGRRPPLQRDERSAEPEWAALYSAPFPGWEFLAPLVQPHSHHLLSLFRRPVLLWDEGQERDQRLTQIMEDFAARYDEVRDTVPPPPRPEEIML